MFSSTTIESSTTIPITSTSASSDSTLIENPITCITAKVPTREIGIEIEVMMVVAFERRKKRLTSTTSANVIASVFQTSSSVARTKMVLSVESASFMPSGRLSLDLGDFGVHPVRDFQLVRARLAHDADAHVALAAHGAHQGLVVVGAELDPADVADAHDAVAVSAHHDALVFAGIVDLRVEVDDEATALCLERAGRDLEVVLQDGATDIGGGHFARGHLGRIEPDPHREAAAADAHPRHPGQELERRFDDAVAGVGEVDVRVLLAGQAEPHDRLRLGSGLGDDRLLGLGREVAQSLLDGVRDVGRRQVDVAAGLELDVDRADQKAEVEVMVRTPSMPFRTCSIGSTMVASIVSGLAPK